MPLDCPLTHEEATAAQAAFDAGDGVGDFRKTQVAGWQSRLGVRPDGLAGPRTRAALDAARPDPAPAPAVFHGHARETSAAFSLARDGADFPLGEHFVLMEFASRDGADGVLVHPALVAVLDRLREHFDAPVTVNSGYRTPFHNRRIGGATNSRHVMGLAADVVVRGRAPDEVARFLETLEPGGLGRYPHFTHVDVEGRHRRWDER